MSSRSREVINYSAIEELDYRDLRYDAFLANLQGNILKGHGRDNTVHLMVRFTDAKAAKEWISNFANEITSCKEQLRQRELFKRNGTPGSLFTAIYFSKSFYEFIGADLNGFEPAFVEGMKVRANRLKDNHCEWEQEYFEELHAMVLLAHDDLVELGKATTAICKKLEEQEDNVPPIAKVVAIEYGSAIRNANGDGLEHFGYVDGISQPLFLVDEVAAYNSQNIKPILFDPKAPLGLVIVPDHLTGNPDYYGSYFVFRKLEQDVRSFKQDEERLAGALGLADEDAERVGAMILGRFEDGSPVTLSATEGMISGGIMNNFTYDEGIHGSDKHGARCPLHAHIRKTNSRTDADRDLRMARRGITYGHRNVRTSTEQTFVQCPTKGVGLLFMSFQTSIQAQFEKVQQNANSETHGIDLIIGQVVSSRICEYAKIYNDAKSKDSQEFGKYVITRGGEYFFTPSIGFLKSLHTKK